jgi:flagellar motor protein MotB
MRNRKWIIPFFFALLLLAGNNAVAQFGDSLKLKTIRSVFLQEADSGGAHVARASFPNVNLFPYYANKGQLARIKEKLDEDEYDRRLKDYLDDYIGSFGIQNFKRDGALLWAAAEVNEALGDIESSLMYYELAMKHAGPRKSLNYDRLIAPTRSEWVSIEKYQSILNLRKRIDTLIPPKAVLKNMGPAINSGFPEYAPFMHPSDSVLIFTSRRSEEVIVDDIFGRKNEDLYFSVKSFISGSWGEAEIFSSAINTESNEGSACLSPDGKILYFTRCNDFAGHGDCDIYQAEYEAGEWVNIKNLGGKVNSREWDSQPSITTDGNILFFASNRDGGFGGTDIYYAIKGENGEWSEARNLGPVPNTAQNEVTPFYHRINQTLYFSSTGHLKSYGSYDIYKSRWIHGSWEEPKNLGPLVNGEGNEYYFSIDSKGETIFYSRSDDNEMEHDRQNFDLYSFPMPMEARPDAVQSLQGFLIDSVSGHSLTGTVMIVDLDNGIEIAPKRINEDGFFEFDLRGDNNYRIYVLGSNFLTIRNDLYLEGDTTFSILTESISKEKPIVFESLEFDEDSYTLKRSSIPKLNYIVDFLKNYPMFNLTVKGHTDADGDEDYNLRLSLLRAEQIRTYIQREGGFTDERVSAEGYGETRPIYPNDTEEHKRKNRRVEFAMAFSDTYKGEMWLPEAEEFDFEDVIDEYDPEEFMEEFEWDLDELDLDEEDWDLDLETEFEDLFGGGDKDFE